MTRYTLFNIIYWLIFIGILPEVHSQSSIYLSPEASLSTFPGSQISIYGDIINDSKGGFNHQNGGDVYIIRHSKNGNGSSKIIDGPYSVKPLDNYNTGGSYCRFWNLHTDNTVSISNPSGTKVNTRSGSGNIEIYQEIRVSNIHYFVNGIIWSPRDEWKNAFLHYDSDSSSYQGADDKKHIDGYVAKSGSNDFIFPAGDGKIMRNCGIVAPENGIYKAAYFSQNPFNGTIGLSGNNINPNITDNISEKILKVCSTEFWDIDGTGMTKVFLVAENQKYGYSEWIHNFSDYNVNSIVITGFDGNWKNLGLQETSNLNYTSNNSFQSIIKCVPDSGFTLFTWLRPILRIILI